MNRFEVTGMSCDACRARVEKTVSGLSGVESCSVSLLTSSMIVEGNVNSDDIIKAVREAGYDAQVLNEEDSHDSGEDLLKDKESPILKKRLLKSLGVLLVLMYFSMGHTMWNFPVPGFLKHGLNLAILEMVLCLIVLYFNRKFFINGFKALIHKAPNMDTLVALGASASFLYSLNMKELYFESAAMIVTLITVGKLLESVSKGRTTDALKNLYKMAPKTAIVVRDGQEREVDISEVRLGDIFVVHPGESIPVDGIILEGSAAIDESALTGESIPVDKEKGDMVSAATINRSGYLTCRATRVGKDTTFSQIIRMVSDAAITKAPIARIADRVSAFFVPAVIIIAIVTGIGWMIAGRDFSFAFSRAVSVLIISCPCALGLATPVAVMVGSGLGAKNGILFKTAEALERIGRTDIVVLDKTGTITTGKPVVTDVIPAGTESGVQGEYDSDCQSRDEYGTTDVFIKGEAGLCDDESCYSHPDVAGGDNGKIEYVYSGVSDELNLIRIAYALEKRSEHPLASAVVAYAESNYDVKDLEIGSNYSLEEFKVLPGNGLSASLVCNEKYASSLETDTKTESDNKSGDANKTDGPQDIKTKDYHIGSADTLEQGCDIAGGSLKYLESIVSIPEEIRKQAQRLAEMGKTPLVFSKGSKLLGLIAVADTIKEDSRQAILEMKQMGLKVVMLTGDNSAVAENIAHKAGVDKVVAGVLPEGKEAVIRELQKDGKVTMIGDGINDAPALTAADIGVSVGAGTDVAIDAAEIVLMKNSIVDGAAAIRLSRATIRNIHENLFWAFFYNIICIPLAMGLYGITMKPMYGAAAMSLSSFCVCMNALRLNLFKLYTDKSTKAKPVIKHSVENMVVLNQSGTDNTAFKQTEVNQSCSGKTVANQFVTENTADKHPPQNTSEYTNSIDGPTNSDTCVTDDADKETLQNTKERIMKKELKIEGMMCAHCEANVKKALEALTGVVKADVSHEKNNAVVELSEDVTDEILKETVEAKDYKVLDIQTV
ncbi:MAG: HAD-IC family P-type ATPase [Lachnospiraceae bacterium]|nr:HAD-IC family P-type ATPase [Lachnospiraceae bacterium]